MPSGLQTHRVSVSFGGLRVLTEIDLDLAAGEILGLVGPNGAGKTTLVNVLSGFQRPGSGRVSVDDRDLTRLGAHERARLGIVRTFQGVRLFGRLSVLENVVAAGLARGLRRTRAEELAVSLLRRLNLEASADLPAASLPYGHERRVGVARALALVPRYLLLDEPAAGLNRDEALGLIEVVTGIRDEVGCGILLIEHNMEVVFGLCSRVHVLRAGTTLTIGTPAEVRAHPEVRSAYLGQTAA